VVRGLVPDHDDGPGAAALVRPEDEDMFSLGTAEARAEGLRLAAALGADRSEAGEPQLLPVVGERARTRLLALLPDPVPPDAELVLPTTADPADPLICAAAGAAVQRLRAAHHARNRTTIWVPVPVGTVTSIVRVPPGSVPLGVLGSWPSPG
ncbi:MAG: hypothetical protein KJO75_21750, partial [Dactylosporangium sp.]|nr:hypothetical protein [Dactylosporangium sp.]